MSLIANHHANRKYNVKDIALYAETYQTKVREIINDSPVFTAMINRVGTHMYFSRASMLEIVEAAEAAAYKSEMKRKIIKLSKKPDEAPDPAFTPENPSPGVQADIKADIKAAQVKKRKETLTALGGGVASDPLQDKPLKTPQKKPTRAACPAQAGKFCPRNTSCPWWIDVRLGGKAACAVYITAVSLDEIAHGEELDEE